MSSSTSFSNQNILITPLSNLVENGQIVNPENLPRPLIFLSGTTNYNKAEKRWQQALTEYFISPSFTITSSSNTKTPLFPPSTPLTIIDPYNPTWDSTWSEDRSDERFVQQVHFEIRALEVADIIVVGFIGSDVREGRIGAGGAALLELGVALERMGKEKSVVVCAETGFWKRGYVRVLCERFETAWAESLEGLMDEMRWVVGAWRMVKDGGL